MCRLRAPLLALVLAAAVSLALSGPALAEDADDDKGLVPIFRGAYLHQIAADIDDGGRYSVNRAAFQAGPAYLQGKDRQIALVLGYRYDGYTFSRGGAFGQQPWRHVHTLNASLLVKWALDRRWTFFTVPMASISGERGAAYEDALAGGGIAGFTYTFGKKLTIGPGFGVLTQIESPPTVFPVLLVEWKITPKLTFSTGTGVGATQGPGLLARYRPTKAWEFLVGARTDFLRFRLDTHGKTPNGIGEEASTGVVAGAAYRFGPDRLGYLGLLVGVDLLGTLRLEDPQGALIASEAREPAVTIGFNFGVGF